VPAVRSDHEVLVAGSAFSVSDLASRSKAIAARLDCTSGWYTDGVWSAVSLVDLIAPEKLAAAASIEIASVTGYSRRFPANEAGNLWLATAYHNQPLQPAYGAPVRLVAPHRRGFWWVKWVTSVKLSDLPSWAQPPYPLQ
jgi:DMSO/TMAO reductase YedYZ molybdopterin-dependent catalytic subunit